MITYLEAGAWLLKFSTVNGYHNIKDIFEETGYNN